MKKSNFFKYFSLIIFLFIVNFSFVSAKTLRGSVYTSNEHRDSFNSSSLNIFQETKNNTPFANFLYGQGYNIGNYLNNYFGVDDSEFFNSNYDYAISMMSSFDFENNVTRRCDYSGSSVSANCFAIDGSWFTKFYRSAVEFSTSNIDEYSSPSTFSTYVLIFSPNHNSNIKGYGSGHFYSGDNSFRFETNVRYVFFLDSNAQPVGYLKVKYSPNLDDNYKRYSLIFDFPVGDTIDMTSWYSLLFKSYTFATDYDVVYPENFYLDSDKASLVENNAGYTGIRGWFKNAFSKYYTLGNYNLEFVYDDVFYSKSDGLNSLFYIWFTENTYAVPDGYVSVDTSGSKKGIYMVPTGTCEYDDYLLYYSGSSHTSVYSLYFSYYNFLNENATSLKFYKTFGMYSSVAYQNYSYNPLLDLGVSASDFADYALNIYQTTVKYSYNVYYNSSCYTVYDDLSSDIVLNFSGGSYNLTSSEITSNFNNYTIHGTNNSYSVDISQGSSNNNVQNSTGVDFGNYNDSFSIADIAVGLYDKLTAFLDSIKMIVNTASVFLLGLPPDIYSVLISMFTLGLIMIMIKLLL